MSVYRIAAERPRRADPPITAPAAAEGAVEEPESASLTIDAVEETPRQRNVRRIALVVYAVIIAAMAAVFVSGFPRPH